MSATIFLSKLVGWNLFVGSPVTHLKYHWSMKPKILASLF